MIEFQGLSIAIGNVVHRRRVRSRLSQQQLADRAGLERSYLSLLESGKRMSGVEIVFRLAAAFNISPKTLFYDIELSWRERQTDCNVKPRLKGGQSEDP